MIPAQDQSRAGYGASAAAREVGPPEIHLQTLLGSAQPRGRV